MNIKTQLLPSPSKRRSGIKNIGVKFIVCHDTGNINSTAQNNVDYFTWSANDVEASAHIFVDDIQSITCVPEDEKAWHVLYGVTVDNSMFGVDANDAALGVELCYFDDLNKSRLAYQNYAQVIANLCKKYGLDPKTKLVGHNTLDPARKTDPANAMTRISISWVQFVKDVDNIVNPPQNPPTVPNLPSREQAIAEIKRLSVYL